MEFQGSSNSNAKPSWYDEVNPVTFNTTKEAIGTISFLFSFDQRFRDAPFSNVINDIYCSVMHGFYSVAARQVGQQNGEPLMQPLAVLCWGMFSPSTAVLRANNIRPLAPIEFKSGDKPFFTMFSSPFEDPAEMMTLLRNKDSKLQGMANITFVDNLFKPDYNFNIK